MGRPTKLTPKLQKHLCELIAGGNFYQAACACCNLDYATFARWMARGRDEESGPYRDFCEAVEKAEAEAEALIVNRWVARTPEEWQACRDFLARRHPSRWGPKEKHEHSGPDGGPIAHKDANAPV